MSKREFNYTFKEEYITLHLYSDKTYKKDVYVLEFGDYDDENSHKYLVVMYNWHNLYKLLKTFYTVEYSKYIISVLKKDNNLF